MSDEAQIIAEVLSIISELSQHIGSMVKYNHATEI